MKPAPPVTRTFRTASVLSPCAVVNRARDAVYPPRRGTEPRAADRKVPTIVTGDGGYSAPIAARPPPARAGCNKTNNAAIKSPSSR